MCGEGLTGQQLEDFYHEGGWDGLLLEGWNQVGACGTSLRLSVYR